MFKNVLKTMSKFMSTSTSTSKTIKGGVWTHQVLFATVEEDGTRHERHLSSWPRLELEDLLPVGAIMSYAACYRSIAASIRHHFLLLETEDGFFVTVEKTTSHVVVQVLPWGLEGRNKRVLAAVPLRGHASVTSRG